MIRTEHQTSLTVLKRSAIQARSTSELNIAFRSFVRRFGFTAYAVGFAPHASGSDEPFLLLDWPPAWLELYAREGFASEDAVVAEAATATEPFTWLELQAKKGAVSARIFAAARVFGWTDGLLVPIRVGHSPGSTQLGVASLAAATLEGFDSEMRMTVVKGVTVAFLRAIDLSDRPRGKALSEREREAITMVAAGRGDREIAVAFNISVATAHFHVEQAKRKLGAVTRAQAVALAIAQGFVVIR